MDERTPPQYERERWDAPARGRVLFVRVGSVSAVALVVFASPWLLSGESVGDAARMWQDVMSIVALLCVVPLAAVAWSSLSKPVPHDRTMLVLKRALAPAERKSVAAALRRGDPVDPAHRAYARASVARQRPNAMFLALMTAMLWAQALNAAGEQIGSGIFWLMTVGAVGVTAASVAAVVLHVRMERGVREFAS